MNERITVSPNIHSGKPWVASTRIPVLSVLEPVWQGVTFPSIIQDYYPELDVEDIRDCVRYAMDVLEAEDLHVAT